MVVVVVVVVVGMLLLLVLVLTLSVQDGTTALYAASEAGHAEVVELLIDAGADVNLANSNDATPLMVACENGETAVGLLLLDADADVTKHLPSGETALFLACQQGHLKLVQAICDKTLEMAEGLDDSELSLKDSRYDSREFIRRVLDKQSEGGATAAHMCAARGFAPGLKLLLSFEYKRALGDGYFGVGVSCDLTLRDADGWTPLHAAAFNNAGDEVLLLLIEHEAARLGSAAGGETAQKAGWLWEVMEIYTTRCGRCCWCSCCYS